MSCNLQIAMMKKLALCQLATLVRMRCGQRDEVVEFFTTDNASRREDLRKKLRLDEM